MSLKDKAEELRQWLKDNKLAIIALGGSGINEVELVDTDDVMGAGFLLNGSIKEKPKTAVELMDKSRCFTCREIRCECDWSDGP